MKKNLQNALTILLFYFDWASRIECFVFRRTLVRQFSVMYSSNFNINLISPGIPSELSTELNAGSLETLLGTPREIEIDQLITKLSKSKLKEGHASQLNAVLELAMAENANIVLIDSKPSTQSADEIYVTESALRQLWLEKSTQPMGKAADTFELMDSLLLLDDEEDFGMNSEDDSDELNTNEDENEDEIYVTRTELERIWNARAAVSWGMPGKQYSDLDGLLLLDDDDNDEVFHGEGSEGLVEYVPSRLNTLSSDEEGFWDQVENQEIVETLKKVYAELEDSSFKRPAWKKERYVLTPDIDTQKFVGDIMMSNTMMTQRIPANWNDNEEEGMSEAYLSTGTMAWPDEPETDYNQKVPIWELLNLPVGPDFDPLTGERLDSKSASDQGSGGPSAGESKIDWETFDFSAADKNPTEETPVALSSGEIDVDMFFKSMAKPLSAGAGDDEEDANDDESNDGVSGSGSVEDLGLKGDKAITPGNLVTRSAARNQKNWVTPKKWLKSQDYLAAVDYDEWSSYDNAVFSDLDSNGEPIWTKDDIYTAISVHHILRVTDTYLTDHVDLNTAGADRRYWERVLQSKLANDESIVREPIPVYLTPDKDRNIEYTQEIIEMKSKITLEVKLADPAVEYANDTFTYNEDLQPVNKIGTIRDQYDWKDLSDPSTWKIEPAVLKKIQPVVEYINHAGILRSTKGNVLIFEYLGNMRHVLGIRASMLDIAKKHFPELVDLRLETSRTHDKFDI